MANSIAINNEPFPSGRLTAHEYVRQVLRRAILRGELTPGSRLVQADLAATLDVSTTPVREALRDLASEGLIRLDPHRGAVVSDLNPSELEEIYAIRAVLEPLALRRAVPRLTEVDMETLRGLHHRMETEIESDEWADFNRAFHAAMYQAAGSPRLVSMLRSLQDATVMYIGLAPKMDPGIREQGNREHAALLKALERRDPEAATKVLVKHLGTAQRVFTG